MTKFISNEIDGQVLLNGCQTVHSSRHFYHFDGEISCHFQIIIHFQLARRNTYNMMEMYSKTDLTCGCHLALCFMDICSMFLYQKPSISTFSVDIIICCFFLYCKLTSFILIFIHLCLRFWTLLAQRQGNHSVYITSLVIHQARLFSRNFLRSKVN